MRINSIVSTLKVLRQDSNNEFKKIFAEATKLGKQVNGESFEHSTPRLAGRQLHCSNPPTSEDYFQITLYDEFLSDVITELETRFIDNPSHEITLGLLYLLPNKCISLEGEASTPLELTKVADDHLPHPLLLTTEYSLVETAKSI